jgi:hypothetical protein
MSSVGGINTAIQTGVSSLDPTTPAIIASQQAVSSLGGGLGSVALTIPSVGSSFASFLNSIGDSMRSAFNYVKSTTPTSIAEANSAIKDSSNNVVPEETTYQKAEGSVSYFFSKVFSQTLYIVIFSVAIVLALVCASLAANSIGVGKSVGYYTYYMIYGFILGIFLSPIIIPYAIYRYYKGNRLFYSFIAPIYQGNSMGLFTYDIKFSVSKLTSAASALTPHSKIKTILPMPRKPI